MIFSFQKHLSSSHVQHQTSSRVDKLNMDDRIHVDVALILRSIKMMKIRSQHQTGFHGHRM